MVYEISKNTLGLIVNLYVKEIRGLENVPRRGPYIVAANHSSYMDHLILQNIWARKFNLVLHFLAKKEHFVGLQKIWHKHFKAIPIDRKRGGKTALRKAVSLLKRGEVIGIYPEGTRTLTGKLQKGKTGAIRLALASRVPILPVGIIGTFEMLPKGKIIPRFKRAKVNIGKVMHFDKYYGKKIDKKTLRLLTTRLMKEIGRLCKKRYIFD